MLKKGTIPVPYIIALILGIVVVGILGYGFFVLGWQIPGISSQWQCNTKKSPYCTEWARSGYVTEPQSGDWNAYAPGCADVGVNKPTAYECRLMLGAKADGVTCTDKAQCASKICTITTPATSGVCGT